MNKALRRKMQAEERDRRYAEAGIAVNKSSMWYNPWNGSAEYDVEAYGPSYWYCENCGVRVYEGGDDTCEECGATYEEMEERNK